MARIGRDLFVSPIAGVGVFRCPPHHEQFDGGAVEACLAAFPHTAVIIEQDGRAPVVADPNTAIVYNDAQPYSRRAVDERGDHSDYLALAPEVAAEVSGSAGTGSMHDAGHTFDVDHAPIDPRVCLAQRALVARLERREAVEPIEVEELVITIVGALLSSAAASRPTHPARTSTRRRHRDLVEDTKHYLSTRAGDRLALGDIALGVGSSPFHLSRIFKHHTGRTLHEYLRHLRLHRGLDRLRHRGENLGVLAVELGFASHSHFTKAFRAAFGMTPRQARNRLNSTELGELRKIVKV